MLIANKLGSSAMGMTIESLSIENAKPSILIMSGLHGDEVEGHILHTMLIQELCNKNPALLNKLSFIPVANPDGFSLNQRWNSNSIDLNRNWPTTNWTNVITNPRYPPGPKAGSEIETTVLRNFVASHKFELVIDLHSYKESVLLPLFFKKDSKLQNILTKLGTDLGVPIVFEQEDLGYSISGGFHTWCYEQEIHNLTIELEKGMGQFAIKEKYLAPLLSFVNAYLQENS